MTPIDRASPFPIYHQLKLFIRQRINQGVWQPGDRIPTERELCEAYGISRSPVRQALNELAREGVVIRRPGLGTFVAEHIPAAMPPEISIRMMCSDPQWSDVLEGTSCVWNARHAAPKITFDIEVVPHSEFYDRLTTAVGHGAAPDLAIVDGVWVAGLAKAGFLYALEELRSQESESRFGETLYPAFFDANSLGGRLYGLPIKADASLLWYRKDWFAREGLSAPRDWDDLLNVALHFLRPEVRESYGLAWPLVFPGGVAGGEATVYALLPFVWSAGGQIVDLDAQRVRLDSPATSCVLELLRELIHCHGISPLDVIHYNDDVSARLLAEGKAAMALGGSYQAGLVQSIGGWSDVGFSECIGAAAPPAALGGEQVSTVGGASYVVLRQCEYPAIAMDLLQLATDLHVTGDLYRAMWLNEPPPAVDLLPGSDRRPLVAQVSSMIINGRSRPSLPEYVQISRQLQAMFEAVMLGDEPVQEIVRRTAQFISIITELPCQSGYPSGVFLAGMRGSR